MKKKTICSLLLMVCLFVQALSFNVQATEAEDAESLAIAAESESTEPVIIEPEAETEAEPAEVPAAEAEPAVEEPVVTESEEIYAETPTEEVVLSEEEVVYEEMEEGDDEEPQPSMYENGDYVRYTKSSARFSTMASMTLPDISEYEDKVDNSTADYTSRNAAKWTNADLTEAELYIDFGMTGQQFSGKGVDVILVLDVSGSMRGSRIDALKIAATNMVNDLMDINDAAGTDVVNVAIVAYENTASVVSTFTNNRAAHLAAISGLTAYGGTNAGTGIAHADALFTSDGRVGADKMMVVLSDGDVGSSASTATDTIMANHPTLTIHSIGFEVYSSTAAAALKAISDKSVDGKYYDATTADLGTIFDGITVEIKNKTPIINITKVLHGNYELINGDMTDIEVSSGGGTASIVGDEIIWNVTGVDTDVMHWIKIKVKITDKRLSKTLDTNESLVIDVDGTETDMVRTPVLFRLLADYRFESGTTGKSLPQEIIDMTPHYTGGYRSGVEVTPATVAQTSYAVSDGTWKFKGWTPASQTTVEDNLEFVGIWEFEEKTTTTTKTPTTSSSSGSSGTRASSGSTTRTGDSANTSLYLLIMVMCTLVMFAYVKKYSRKKI